MKQVIISYTLEKENTSKKFFIYIFLYYLVFLFLNNSFSQTDTVNTKDTLLNKIDTSKQVISDIEDIIYYSAEDSAIFDIDSQIVYLYNKAILEYKDLKLQAGVIIYNRNTNILYSHGIQDSVNKTKYVQTPLMFQGNEKYEGLKLSYNFRTQQGVITKGYKEAEVGYYIGEKIKRVTPEVYFIKDGLYTTAVDKEDPEYYFFSPYIKVIPSDKVIAQSVFLYIEGVPVFWVPFAIFPDRKGRSSGIITPTYGNDSRYGVYLAKLGYYWAINDYFDFAITGSAFTKGRFDLNSRFRYALKYNFSGSIEAGFSKINLGEKKDLDKYSSTEWSISLVHNQIINPTTSLNGNLNFVSGKSYYDNSTNNYDILLRQNAISNLTFSKFWEETPYSLSLNYYRDQNLINGDRYESFPSILFNVSEFYPFRRANLPVLSVGKFYEDISFSYNFNARYDKSKRTITNALGQDSVLSDSRPGAKHYITVNYAPRFSDFNIRTFINYTELWYIKSIEKEFNPVDSSVITKEIDGFKPVRYFNMGVSLNTKLIGIFSPNLFGITGIRHTITPSITYNFTPDFSSNFFGYYGSYTDAQGRIIKYSKFEKEIFGGAPFGENQSIGFNIGNLFEMKVKENDTTENKFQLFNFNASINYNFAADSLKWSDLRTDFRTQIGGLLNIAGGATFNLYKFDPTVNARVNKFLISTDGKLADVTNVNFNISTSFNFEITSKKDTIQKEIDEINYKIPISGTLNYNYSQSKPNPNYTFKSSNISGGINFSISENWRFTFSTSYDILSKKISAPYFSAYRDLKSWELLFDWYPTGQYSGFRLEIRIKAPQLRDIRVTKQTNTRGVY
ncbi:MAG: putative LPS assembly protein LptD [Ignavibacteria bacterium]|nr:putative LPS assembly protein LptD [Ignavibacteria bacterium]